MKFPVINHNLMFFIIDMSKFVFFLCKQCAKTDKINIRSRFIKLIMYTETVVIGEIHNRLKKVNKWEHYKWQLSV